MEHRITAIDFTTAKQILDAEKNAVILDVREEEEYNTGHAEGALLFPLDEISSMTAAELIPDKDAPLLVYCRTGRRSRIAASRLQVLGYTRIYDMGSLAGWPYGLDY